MVGRIRIAQAFLESSAIAEVSLVSDISNLFYEVSTYNTTGEVDAAFDFLPASSSITDIFKWVIGLD